MKYFYIYYNCLWFISVGSILWSRWAYKTFGQTDGQGLVYNSETNIQTCSCVANNRNENSPLCLSMQSKSFLSSVLWLQCCSMSAIDCAWKYTQTINISYCWLLNISSGIWGVFEGVMLKLCIVIGLLFLFLTFLNQTHCWVSYEIKYCSILYFCGHNIPWFPSNSLYTKAPKLVNYKMIYTTVHKKIL